MKLTESQIERAANWWADQVMAPVFDNGSSDTGSSMAAMVATANADEVTPAAKQKFIEVMKQALTQRGEEAPRCISVDYQPDMFLKRCMTEAKIFSGNAPWKTHMYFDEQGGVRVAQG